MITITIPPLSEPPKTGDSHQDWRVKADAVWADLYNIVPLFNQFSDQANGLANDVNNISTETLGYRNDTLNAQNEAIAAKNRAVSAESTIQGYVIPTNATVGLDDYNANLDEIVRVTTAQSIQISLLANQYKG